MEKIRAKNHKRIGITYTQSRENLRSQLKEGALGRAKRDVQLAEDWCNMKRVDRAFQISLGLVEI